MDVLLKLHAFEKLCSFIVQPTGAFFFLFAAVFILLKYCQYKYWKKRSTILCINKARYSKQEIVEEIHYAACYCKENPSLIPLCKEMVSLYPEACNYPMPNHNYTPFLRACWNGCPKLIAYMIHYGADINATTDAGEGGIYLATYCMIRTNDKSFETLTLLIRSGLDVNKARYDGYTALHLAASRGCAHIVKRLLLEGAHPAPVGSPSAAQLAKLYGHPKLAAILR